MSLINDALKKAQKQRTGDTPPLASMPGIGGETATHIAKRAKPAGFNALLLRCGLIGGGVIVLLLGGYFAIRASRRVPAAAPAAGVADPGTKDAPVPASPRPATPAPAISPTSTPAVSFNLPIAPAIAASQSIAPEAKPVAGVADPGPGPAAPRPATPASTAVKPAPVITAKLEGKAIIYIEALRIAGIRASATDSKLLMNDRVYRIGDIVEHDLGLKLVGITSSSLTFENEAGARYTRNF
ncbi:MAG: hypothetical protein JWQ83_1126 [Lacunisphaera sp.]|nr:hypothetical protein [Lacunisphaera sp.]